MSVDGVPWLPGLFRPLYHAIPDTQRSTDFDGLIVLWAACGAPAMPWTGSALPYLLLGFARTGDVVELPSLTDPIRTLTDAVREDAAYVLTHAVNLGLDFKPPFFRPAGTC